MKPKYQVATLACYLRVSSDETQNPENSFDRQQQSIETSISSRTNLKISRIYSEIESGTKADRAELGRLIDDARAGLFSDLAIDSLERLGRNPKEIFEILEILTSLGIKLWVANNPGLEIGTPTGNFQLGIQAVTAKFEVDLLSQRISQTKRALMLRGKWPNHPPDGYVSKRREVGPRQFECWIEQEPKQAEMVRTAYDLWLTGQFTIKQICEELDKKGFTRGSGKPFVWMHPQKGTLQFAGSHVQRILTNPFYEGWVVSKTHGITPGDVEGEWKPIVTHAEADQSRKILRDHDHNKSRKKVHPYLLRGILWLVYGTRTYRLYGSTPKGRSRYYKYYRTKARINGKSKRIDRETVESNIPSWLQHIEIDRTKIVQVRRIYDRHIDQLRSPLRHKRLAAIEERIRQFEEEEAHLARLLVTGKVSEETYDRLCKEWQKKLISARQDYNRLKRDVSAFIDDLELGLRLISRASFLFDRLTVQKRSMLLKILVRKLTVNEDGDIVAWDLNPPFEYLSSLANGTVMYQHPPNNEDDSSRASATDEFAHAANLADRKSTRDLLYEGDSM